MNPFVEPLTRLKAVALKGTGYRVINAQYLRTPLSAIGSKLRGGRYNPKGNFEVLYLANSQVTALLEVESLLYTSKRLRPKSAPVQAVLTVDYKLSRVVDLTKARNQQALGITQDDLLKPWLLGQARGDYAITQQIGMVVQELGSIEALKVPCAKKPSEWNLAVFLDNLGKGSSYTLYDPEGLIPRIHIAPSKQRDRE